MREGSSAHGGCVLMPCRQKMIEEWEAREWDEREREIHSVQDERLELLDQAIQVGGVFLLPHCRR